MKRILVFLTALGVAQCFGIALAFAQHGGGHAGGPGAGGGTGSSMGRGSEMGGTRANAPMGGEAMGRATVSHNSPTTLLSSNTKLASNLQQRLGSMLPSGMSVKDAASGFRNLGQFIAAVHVSHNLGIPFEDLKSKMTGGDSLGKAISTLKPDADSKSEAKKANKQAKDDLHESTS